MISHMSPRERMLNALDCKQPDHTPCAFMLYGALHKQSEHYLDFIDRQMELGLDVFVELPPRPPVLINDFYNLHGLPVSYHADVAVHERVVKQGGETVLHKTYQTPDGDLSCEVVKTADWRWGNHIPFLDDYITPRARSFPIKSADDLPAF